MGARNSLFSGVRLGSRFDRFSTLVERWLKRELLLVVESAVESIEEFTECKKDPEGLLRQPSQPEFTPVTSDNVRQGPLDARKNG